jgi:hypothetical protein
VSAVVLMVVGYVALISQCGWTGIALSAAHAAIMIVSTKPWHP